VGLQSAAKSKDLLLHLPLLFWSVIPEGTLLLPFSINQHQSIAIFTRKPPSETGHETREDSTMKKHCAGWVALAAMWTIQTVQTGTPTAHAQSPSVPGMAETAVITLPAGTKIPLTLVSVIRSKTTKVGDSVRGQVAFPVTVGSEVAIPAGSYVEGIVTRLTPATRKTRQPDVEIHFTRLLFTNGYAISLDATSEQAVLTNDEDGTVAANANSSEDPGMEGFAFVGQQPLPPLPHTGPSPGVIAGIFAGSTALLVGGLVWGHHRAGSQDAVLLDAGWQFAMVTQTPLVLDAARVKAAAVIGN